MSWCWGGCPHTQQDAVAPGRMLSRLGWFHHTWEDTWEDARAAGRMPARLLRELLQINTRNKKNPPALPTPAHRLLPPVRSRSRPRSPLPAASGIPLRQPAALQSPRGGAAKSSARTHPPRCHPTESPTRATSLARPRRGGAEGEKPPAPGDLVLTQPAQRPPREPRGRLWPGVPPITP